MTFNVSFYRAARAGGHLQASADGVDVAAASRRPWNFGASPSALQMSGLFMGFMNSKVYFDGENAAEYVVLTLADLAKPLIRFTHYIYRLVSTTFTSSRLPR